MGQSRMDNPETLTHGAIKNGQSRNIDTWGNQEWTIQKH